MTDDVLFSDNGLGNTLLPMNERTSGRFITGEAQLVYEALSAISSAVTDIHNDGRAHDADIRNMQNAVEGLRKMIYGIYCRSKETDARQR